MSASSDPAIERLGGKAKETIAQLESRVKELERVCLALTKAIKDAETEINEPLMPAGEYYGIKFED